MSKALNEAQQAADLMIGQINDPRGKVNDKTLADAGVWISGLALVSIAESLVEIVDQGKPTVRVVEDDYFANVPCSTCLHGRAEHDEAGCRALSDDSEIPRRRCACSRYVEAF